MKLRSSLAILTMIASAVIQAEVPDVDDFRVVPQFPQPADGAFGVVGTNIEDGRFLFWDGDTVYLQDTPGGSKLESFATGYLGDPGFIAVNPDNNTALLGAGFGNGTTANLFLLNLVDPVDFEEGTQIVGPSHFAGAFLNDTLIILDSGKADFSGSELIVLDIFAAATRGTTPRTVMRFPESEKGTRIPIVDKPEMSFASLVHIDRSRNRVYAMDANTTELRWFSLADIILAFNTETPLDWSKDGTPVGTPGDFFSGGVSGVTPDGELVIGGSAGFGMPGGIQFIDPADPVTILDTLDPAGDMPFYNVIYNQVRDQMVAIDATFGVPLQAYATEMGIAPIPAENPSDDDAIIREQTEDFIADFSVLTDDMDADEIPDLATLELFLTVASLYTDEAVIPATRNAYDFNLESLDTEPQAEDIAPYREAIAAFMCISGDMQAAITAILQTGGITLTGTYVAVTCSDIDTCLPEFVEDTDPELRRVSPRTAEEPYSGSGDLDEDGFTNLQEFNNVIASGGDFIDYVVAAFSDLLSGDNAVTGGGSGGGCIIATAAYGTPLAGELQTIRQFRNQHLLPSKIGAIITDTYYRVSTTLTPWVVDKPLVLSGVRGAMAAMLFLVQNIIPVAFLIIVALSAARARRGSYRSRH